jgi:AraC-like DNA-binding protein
MTQCKIRGEDMLNDFSRECELADGLESEYLKLLYYDLSPMNSEYKTYEFSRLCTILDGYKHISVNGELNLTYYPGQFILLPPHSKVQMEISTSTKALVFELNNELLKKVTEKIKIDLNIDYNLLDESRFFHGDITNELGTCMNKLSNTAIIYDKNKEFLLDLYAQELTYHLVKIKGVQQVINLELDNPIYKAIKYIQNNIEYPINISQLAYDLNMSKGNFSNSFKRFMNITPKEYITNLKLIKAKKMLKTQNVTEVAYDLGYDNISYFIAIFKDKYGITPKQYKSIGDGPINFKTWGRGTPCNAHSRNWGYNKLGRKVKDNQNTKGKIYKKRERRNYTDEFKQQVVQLYNTEKSRTEIIREYDLTPLVFNSWLKRINKTGSDKEKDNRTAQENNFLFS